MRKNGMHRAGTHGPVALLLAAAIVLSFVGPSHCHAFGWLDQYLFPWCHHQRREPAPPVQQTFYAPAYCPPTVQPTAMVMSPPQPAGHCCGFGGGGAPAPGAAPFTYAAASPVAAAPTAGFCTNQTVCYTPEIRYRWTFAPVARTNFLPVTMADPCTGCPTTTYQPVTSYSILPWLHQEPYVDYTQTVAPAAGVGAVGMPACPTCPPTPTTFYTPTITEFTPSIDTACPTCPPVTDPGGVAVFEQTIGAPVAGGCPVPPPVTGAPPTLPANGTYSQPQTFQYPSNPQEASESTTPPATSIYGTGQARPIPHARPAPPRPHPVTGPQPIPDAQRPAPQLVSPEGRTAARPVSQTTGSRHQMWEAMLEAKGKLQ